MNSKEAFTLIELLIVIVIIGLLVTMALPQYRTAMEKGRALEAMHNAAAMSDAANVYYIRNNNSYTKGDGMAMTAAEYIDSLHPTTQDKFFQVGSTVNTSAGTVDITLTRTGSKKPYVIHFVSQAGAVSERYCTGDERICKAIGATTTHAGGGWSF